MFVQLKDLAARGPIAMMIVAEADSLRVTVTQKAGSGKNGAPISISAVGTPEELDRDLVDAIAAGAVEQTGSVLEQVQTQLAAGNAAETTGKTSAPPRAAKKKAPARATPKPRKVAAPKAKAHRGPPATAKPKNRVPRASKPGKPECIADFKALSAKHGDKLNREIFVKRAATGRRFEKLWSGWKEFVAEAQGVTAPGPGPTVIHGKLPGQAVEAARLAGDANAVPSLVDAPSAAAPQADTTAPATEQAPAVISTSASAVLPEETL